MHFYIFVVFLIRIEWARGKTHTIPLLLQSIMAVLNFLFKKHSMLLKQSWIHTVIRIYLLKKNKKNTIQNICLYTCKKTKYCTFFKK